MAFILPLLPCPAVLLEITCDVCWVSSTCQEKCSQMADVEDPRNFIARSGVLEKASGGTCNSY